jgi:hypothetical protein
VISVAAAGSRPQRVTLAAAAATMISPVSPRYQCGLASSGNTAIRARPAATQAAGSGWSRVASPASAAITTAPQPAQNQAIPEISGYSDIEARMTAAAVVKVSR